MIGDTRDCPSPKCPGTQEVTGTGPGVQYWECVNGCGRFDREAVEAQDHPGQLDVFGGAA